jgi:hypothetical protein
MYGRPLHIPNSELARGDIFERVKSIEKFII